MYFIFVLNSRGYVEFIIHPDSVNSENARRGICVTGEMQTVNATHFPVGSEKFRHSHCRSPVRYILN